ncbi:hypothetical protein JTB14_031992 [Gonioctena quinquepunctata]|nr:hypothetical protein JTB14_031992 [Gonioctena quinquepunctata]
MIKQYNHFMGGVVLLDGLISYSRIALRSRKWYLKIFFHFIGYSHGLDTVQDRHGKHRIAKKDIIDSLSYRGEVAEGLCHLGNDLNSRKRGIPSGSIERQFQEERKRSQTKPIPQFDVRTDKVGYFPCEEEQRQRCKKPNCGLKTYFYCIKCGVYLCINKKRNCFAEFHI